MRAKRHWANAVTGGTHESIVLLEKPMVMTPSQATRLQEVARRSSAKLMIAYRLHCDPFYVHTIRRIRDGEIGTPSIFTASFTMQVRAGDIRTHARLGGVSVPDLGIYCINAARSVFVSEPVEVRSLCVSGKDKHSREVDEMTSAIMRFPGDQLATFTSSFGSASTSWFQVFGTKGSLCLDSVFDESGKMVMTIVKNGKKNRTRAIYK